MDRLDFYHLQTDNAETNCGTLVIFSEVRSWNTFTANNSQRTAAFDTPDCRLCSLTDVLCVFQGYYDNPKVCALYVMKGTLEGECEAPPLHFLLLRLALTCRLLLRTDVPKLQPHPGMEKHEEDEEEEEDGEVGEDGGKKRLPAGSKPRVQSGPRTPNPYAADNSSLMFPILVAFGVFIPTLFCLCRL